MYVCVSMLIRVWLYTAVYNLVSVWVFVFYNSILICYWFLWIRNPVFVCISIFLPVCAYLCMPMAKLIEKIICIFVLMLSGLSSHLRASVCRPLFACLSCLCICVYVWMYTHACLYEGVIIFFSLFPVLCRACRKETAFSRRSVLVCFRPQDPGSFMATA